MKKNKKKTLHPNPKSKHGIPPPRESFKANPKRKSVGRRVWAIANGLKALRKRMPTRKEVITVAKRERLPETAVSNHFYRWKRFHGVPVQHRKAAKPVAKKRVVKKPVVRKAVVKKAVTTKPKPSVKKTAPKGPGGTPIASVRPIADPEVKPVVAAEASAMDNNALAGN